MRRSGRLFVLAIALAATACASAPNKTHRPERVGTPLPALELPLLDGGAWRSDRTAGSVLVIDVWASWCKPCRKGFPLLDEIARRHTDATFVAISIDEDEAPVRAFLAEVPIGVPIALDAAQTTTRAPLNVQRVPTIIVVDRRGIVRLRLEEPTPADYAEVDRAVGAMLSE